MLFELIKVVITGLATGLAIIAGAFLTARYWSAWQKRRDLQLAAADEFYKLYGEFFAVWKLWNLLKGKDKFPHSEGVTQWDLLKRASAAEGDVEALFVRLVSERRLDEEHIKNLGRFRQGYQRLRETIRTNRPIPWSASDHPEYLSFKHLASYAALLFSSRSSFRLPKATDASIAFSRITSNVWEDRWVLEQFKDGWSQTPSGWYRS